MDTAKGVLVLILLLVATGAGGYFFGTYQKFAPIQYVASGTPGAVEQSASTTPTSSAPSQLKKHYWIKSSGTDHIGYAVTTYVNDQLVDKFYTPDKQVEITRFVKPGENSIRFDAKALPVSMNEHRGDSVYKFSLSVQSGSALDELKPGTLIDYTRNAAEDKDYNDTMTFVAQE